MNEQVSLKDRVLYDLERLQKSLDDIEWNIRYGEDEKDIMYVISMHALDARKRYHAIKDIINRVELVIPPLEDGREWKELFSKTYDCGCIATLKASQKESENG